MNLRKGSAAIFTVAVFTLACPSGNAQVRESNPLLASSSADAEALHLDETAEKGEAALGVVRVAPVQAPVIKPWRPFSRVGVAWHTGINGVGFDVATPLARKFNVRTGLDFFHYSFAFEEEGANIDAAFRMRSGHAALDWFPFGGRFRLSPSMVFGNNNQIRATALIPSGSMLSLNGQDYISSYSDPLHGWGSVTFRKVSPGMTFGVGNMIPRSRSRMSFPVEVGFYYVGQPTLKVAFTGSACDPNYPAAVGCQPVMQDPGFQRDLANFIARNKHNLSYASFFPVFSVGFGYSF